LKAFKRLIARLKKEFPRLPVMLLIDGLYPNISTFDLAKQYGYPFAITLKDKSLKSVQEQMSDIQRFGGCLEKTVHSVEPQYWVTERYKVYEKVQYKGHELYVFETIKNKTHKKTGERDKTRFVHITNIVVSDNNVHKVSRTARLRWKIENEGFNIQKNKYYLTHKYSRTSFNATKNYYQLLQIAEMINQFAFKQRKVTDWLKEYGLTVDSLFDSIKSKFNEANFTDEEINNEKQRLKRVQLRY